MDLSLVVSNGLNFMSGFFSTTRQPWSDTQIMKAQCCNTANCNLFLSRYDILHVRSALVTGCSTHNPPAAMGSMTQSIKKWLVDRCSLQGSDIKLDSNVNGKEVCYKMLSRVINMPITRIETTISKYFGNQVDLNGRTGILNPSLKTIDTVANCLTVSGRFGQFDPRGGIILPPTVTKKLLYKNRAGIIVRRRRVDMILDQQMRLRKRDSFLNCNLCVAIRAESESSNITRRQEAIMWRQLHSMAVVRELCYVSHVEQMSREHEDILLLKIDACGKARTKIPAMRRRPKSIGDADRQHLDLITVQIPCSDGLSFLNYDYLSIFEGINTSTTDYIVTALLVTLQKLDHIPSTLFINLDNVLIQKSKAFFGAMGIILFYNSFGHTHSSVDAHFGSLKRKLDVEDCFTPDEMKNTLFSIGYTNAEYLCYSYKIKDVVENYAAHYTSRHNYRHFRIYRDGGTVKFDADEFLNKLIPINHRSVIAGDLITGKDRGLPVFNSKPKTDINVLKMDVRKVGKGASKLKSISGGYWNQNREVSLNALIDNQTSLIPNSFASVIDSIKSKIHLTVNPLDSDDAAATTQMHSYFNNLGYKTNSRARPGGLKPDPPKKRRFEEEKKDDLMEMDESDDENQLSDRSEQL